MFGIPDIFDITENFTVNVLLTDRDSILTEKLMSEVELIGVQFYLLLFTNILFEMCFNSDIGLSKVSVCMFVRILLQFSCKFFNFFVKTNT